MSHYEDVIEFNTKVLDLPQTEALNEERLAWFDRVINEELGEFREANAKASKVDMLDAIIDLIYFAYGRAFEIGISPETFEKAWKAVQAANMKKKKGNKGRGSDYDAVKPKGWESPEKNFGIENSKELNKTYKEIDDAIQASMIRAIDEDKPALIKTKVVSLDDIPTAYIEATELCMKKSQDYNNGNTAPQSRANYFPFGLISYAQMLHTKTQRLNSLAQQTKTPNNESVRDTLLDMINYANFAIEAIDKGEI